MDGLARFFVEGFWFPMDSLGLAFGNRREFH